MCPDKCVNSGCSFMCCTCDNIYARSCCQSCGQGIYATYSSCVNYYTRAIQYCMIDCLDGCNKNCTQTQGWAPCVLNMQVKAPSICCLSCIFHVPSNNVVSVVFLILLLHVCNSKCEFGSMHVTVYVYGLQLIINKVLWPLISWVFECSHPVSYTTNQIPCREPISSPLSLWLNREIFLAAGIKINLDNHRITCTKI